MDYWDKFEQDRYDEWRPRLISNYVRLINLRNRCIKVMTSRNKNPQYCNKSENNYVKCQVHRGVKYYDCEYDCPSLEDIERARLEAM